MERWGSFPQAIFNRMYSLIRYNYDDLVFSHQDEFITTKNYNTICFNVAWIAANEVYELEKEIKKKD